MKQFRKGTANHSSSCRTTSDTLLHVCYIQRLVGLSYRFSRAKQIPPIRPWSERSLGARELTVSILPGGQQDYFSRATSGL